jgi:hypothetical protein
VISTTLRPAWSESIQQLSIKHFILKGSAMSDDEKQKIVKDISQRIADDIIKAVQGSAKAQGRPRCGESHYYCDASSFDCSDFGCEATFSCTNKFRG